MDDRRFPLTVGDPAPWFLARTLRRETPYQFDVAGGRPVLMFFFGSAEHQEVRQALALVDRYGGLFNDERAAFFGISTDPADETEGRVVPRLPGIRFVMDLDHRVTRGFGAETARGFQPHWVLLDRSLRVQALFPPDAAVAAIKATIAAVEAAAQPDWAPVLLAPRILEPELCEALVALYRRGGGQPSGVMRSVDGLTRPVLDAEMKVRRDCVVDDPKLADLIIARVASRLAPLIKRTFQFDATHVERLLIGCYDAEEGGHFRAHRDDTVVGTAHRRFAVTLNLNTDDYEGGDLSFPEFGARTYRAPTGGAVVFSCSLLHQATPVTAGVRYALLPFLYDEAGDKLRAEQAKFLGLPQQTKAEIANVA